MDKPVVYCRIEFIEAVLEKLKTIENDTFYKDLLSFLRDKCYVIHDLTKEDLSKIVEKYRTGNNTHYFVQLIKSALRGGSELIEKPDDFIEMQENAGFFKQISNYIFLLGKQDKFSGNLANDYGLVSANIDTIDNLRFLFDFSLFICSPNENLNSWNFIRSIKHPFNSLIIADNYILKDQTSFNENIIGLLNTILPEKLEKTDFHITIIVEKDTILKDNFQNIYNIVLENIKRPYKINLSIVKVSKEKLHDRNILTSYLWINSGYGFSFFKKGRIQGTTHILALPYSFIKKNENKTVQYESSVFSMYNMLREQFQDISKKAENTKNDNNNAVVELIDYIGNKENRLFD